MIDSAAVMPRDAAERLGLVPRDYASLFVTRTDDGRRITLIGPDLGWLELLLAAPASGLVGMTVPWHKFPVAIYGWPDEWAESPEPVPDPAA